MRYAARGPGLMEAPREEIVSWLIRETGGTRIKAPRVGSGARRDA